MADGTQDTAPAAPAPESNTSDAEAEQSFDSMVADVFGFELGGESPPAAPLVGNQGGGEGGGSPAPSPPSPAPPAEGGPGSAPEAQPATPQGQQPPEPPATPQPSPDDNLTPEQKLELNSLRARAEAVEALLTQQQPQTPPAQGGQQPPAGAQLDENGLPKAQFIPIQLPPAMLEQIFDEDPAKATAGLNMLVSTIASGLSHRFELRLHQIQSAINERFTSQTVAAEEATQAEQAAQHRANYFERFPAHNKPIYQPIIAQTASALAAAHPGVMWDDNFMNALGVKVNTVLAEMGVVLGPGNPTATQGQPAPAAPAAPAAFLPSGSRPVVEEDDNIIAETLEWG